MMAAVKFLLKQSVIMAILTVITLFMVFIMGQFVTLHEDAYFDFAFSVLFVYALVLVGVVLFKWLSRYQVFNSLKHLKSWYEHSGIGINIAIGFTALTVMNSVMMLTGYDVPKTGAFAYLHLLTRLSIFIMVVGIVMYKKLIDQIKNLSIKRSFVDFIKMHWLLKSTVVFTMLTTFICILMLTVSLFMSVQSGPTFYLLLLVMYAVIVFTTFSIHYIPKKTA